MTASDRHAQLLKATAKRLGFDFCGIAKAEFLEKEAPRLEEWLRRDYQGRMGYLANHFDKRLDPRKLVEGAKTVVSLVYNYYPERTLPEGTEDLKLAKYAYGQDYHEVIQEKLREFLTCLRDEVGEIDNHRLTRDRVRRAHLDHPGLLDYPVHISRRAARGEHMREGIVERIGLRVDVLGVDVRENRAGGFGLGFVR
jgi:hypothetical protein